MSKGRYQYSIPLANLGENQSSIYEEARQIPTLSIYEHDNKIVFSIAEENKSRLERLLGSLSTIFNITFKVRT